MECCEMIHWCKCCNFISPARSLAELELHSPTILCKLKPHLCAWSANVGNLASTLITSNWRHLQSSPLNHCSPSFASLLRLQLAVLP